MHKLYYVLALSILITMILIQPIHAENIYDISRNHQVRMCAEWEPALGTLIRWPLGIPSSLVVELAEDDSLYVLVENQSQENQATSSFQTWGVNIEHVHFIRAGHNL